MHGERRDQIRGRELRPGDVQAILASGIIIPGYFHSSVFGLVGDVTTIDPDDAAAAGVLTRLARADHQHAAAAGTPVSVGTVNAEGAGTTWARDNHVHGVAVPAVRAVWSANTNAVSGVDTAVAFGGTDEHDTDTMHNPASQNTRITFTTAGVYSFGGWYEMEQSAELATNLHEIKLRKNGTTVLAQERSLDHGSPIRVSLSSEAKFAAADYVELIVLNGDNVDHNVVAGAFWASYRTAG